MRHTVRKKEKCVKRKHDLLHSHKFYAACKSTVQSSHVTLLLKLGREALFDWIYIALPIFRNKGQVRDCFWNVWEAIVLSTADWLLERCCHSPVKLLSDLPVSSILSVVVARWTYFITYSSHLLGKELHYPAGLGHSQGGEGVNLVHSPLWFISHWRLPTFTTHS